VTKLGGIIEEEVESCDWLLWVRKDLCERLDEIKLLTSLGEICYNKTCFHNKETEKYCYLLDQLMGLEKHARISEDAEARILEETVESSCRQGGIHVSIGEQVVNKENVMNKLQALIFPKMEPLHEKRKVKNLYIDLYIDADENHVSLQYLRKKGDIKKLCINTIMPKLIYVYEDVDFTGKNYVLKECCFFSGDYVGTKELWGEVFDFIKASYDENVLERIYINGDRADWIRTGAVIHEKARFVLDCFHMYKYIIAAINHQGVIRWPDFEFIVKMKEIFWNW